jgi:hypothetical protein
VRGIGVILVRRNEMGESRKEVIMKEKVEQMERIEELKKILL